MSQLVRKSRERFTNVRVSQMLWQSLLAGSVILSPFKAVALPDSQSGNPLPGLGVSTPAGITIIKQDHENPRTIYVGPRAVQEVKGRYAELDSSGPDCASFAQMRHQTYLLPETGLAQKAADAEEYISNYFQLTYAIPAKNSATLTLLAAQRKKLSLASDSAKPIIQEYQEIKTPWDELISEISVKEADKVSTNNAMQLESNKCLALLSTAPDQVAPCMQKAVSDGNAKLSTIVEQLDKLMTRKAELITKYAHAKATYDTATEQLRALESDLGFYTNIFTAQMTISGAAFKLEKDTLKAEEGKVVGKASVGYNLFTDEVTKVADVLAAANRIGYQPTQLGVFNVRLNPGVTQDNMVVAGDNGGAIYAKNVISFPSDTLVHSSIKKNWALPFTKETGQQLYFDTSDADSFRSGAYDFFIAKGARCGEYKKTVDRRLSYTDKEGVKTNWTVTESLWEPTPNRQVFTQSVGLTYNYYQSPGKIRGECWLDVDRMNDYWRSQGSSSSWSAFKKTSRSWSDTRQEIKNNLGIECNLTIKPVSINPQESAKFTENFERHMYEDMWQMFVITYAKSYTIEKLPDDAIAVEKQSSVGANLGSGVMRLCGANAYCAVGALVLKSLDEMGGSKAQGTTSSVMKEYGRISKKFNLDTYALAEESAAINMRVCVDHSQCN